MRGLTTKRLFRRKMPKAFVWKTDSDGRVRRMTFATAIMCGEDLYIGVGGPAEILAEPPPSIRYFRPFRCVPVKIEEDR